MVDKYDKDWGLSGESKDHVEELLEAAQGSLVQLYRERKRIDWRIDVTQKDVLHMCAILGVEVPNPLKELGITDAIRSIVGLSPGPIAPTEIKKQLVEAEVELPESNPLGPVHTILRRLENSKEVQRVAGPNDSITYQWIGGLPPPPVMPKWLIEDTKGKFSEELKKRSPKKTR
jgi:hypothetical protein